MKNNNSGIIFFSGIYGVGKSTLVSKISTLLNIPAYNASELISKKNNETYGKNKLVSDVKKNQLLLSQSVKELQQINPYITLSGHFCIFNLDNSINVLPSIFFENTHVSQIVLLESEISIIIHNLQKRDKISYNNKNLEELQNAEINRAKDIL